jgi:hypothetical protein
VESDLHSYRDKKIPFQAAQTGWSDRRAYVFAELTTPAAPSKEASRHFLDGASTPPVPGGEHPRLRPFREIWLRLCRAKLLVISLSVFLQSGATPECLLFTL